MTAAPRDGTPVRLLTRWATIALPDPHVVEVCETVPGCDAALARLGVLGVTAGGAAPVPASAAEAVVAADVLREAAARGYEVARRALG